MRLTVRAIFSLLCGLWLVACASQAPSQNTKNLKLTQQKVFYFPYDSVWRAAQLALKYPIAVNNMDHGVLETDFIRGDDGFISPTVEKVPSSGIRYKITLTLVKGKIDGRDGVRVTIQKQLEKKRDFFSEVEALNSDGLEEKVLFYRIERELIIDEGLKKAAKSSSSSESQGK
ncbi:MAG: hypothetical protein ACAH59_13455 [Pseudobdellovibrionaceae bacterium]